MKNFLTVLKFELLGLIKKKTFIISTIIILLILAIGLSVPTIKDLFSSDEGDVDGGGDGDITKDAKFGYVDNSGEFQKSTILEENFFAGELKKFESEDQLKEKVNSGEIESGYIIKSPNEYIRVIKNNELLGTPDSAMFEQALITSYRINGFNEKDIEYNEVEELINPKIKSDTTILGKDSASNYLYTYILVFGIYFMIIFYGQVIATSVASEKSNRTMEILVTSTNTTYLIFGKVMAGAIAGVLQFGIILGTAIGVYKLNSEAWNGALDFIFDIPSDVLLLFSVFGILGYLFYSFIFGALGALVSRTEDISASSTPITIIFVAVFMISMFGMQNTEGMLLKVASFVPLSSFMAMFVRVSMGSVSNISVIISLLLLTLSTLLVGYIAAKIYRMGTLMYGNRVKLKDVFKIMRSQ
ncbi:ABC transporter permease [Senegalia massiliensis]|uniref:ABC transporter permease n=1 Tax=Senegalia massiliensis TaxID=1720316 RepID=A0A845QTH2_9CLOT|nr:ABC transporter permease [Senegalia massiliensis]NBI05511.1 ABC transporter permease [Senegalia massiliensis]